jgi:Domain of unknown function (DUF3850)
MPPPVTEHKLKCWPEYFGALLDGTKTFEVRRADRGFEVGDVLWLCEWDTGDAGYGSGYTGRELRRRVTFILEGGHFGVQPGYCVLALS